jgi:hypothetical protein
MRELAGGFDVDAQGAVDDQRAEALEVLGRRRRHDLGVAGSVAGGARRARDSRFGLERRGVGFGDREPSDEPHSPATGRLDGRRRRLPAIRNGRSSGQLAAG